MGYIKQIKSYLSTKRFEKPVSLEELTGSLLDGTERDTGRMEAIEKTASNNSKAIGRLLVVMHDKGLIDDVELCGVLEIDEIVFSDVGSGESP